MPVERISQRLNAGGFSDSEARELRALLAAVKAEVAALRASIVGINAKLDLDAGVTDTNYAAQWTPATGNLLD
jgi:hypothetical protein